MMNRIAFFLLMLCATSAACGHLSAACADWRPPVVILPPPQPQPPQPLPQLPTQHLSLELALKPIPSAPQVVTVNSQAGSAAGAGYSGSATEPSRTEACEPARVETQPEPLPVKTPVPPPVSHSPARETKPVPVDGETGGAPAKGQSRVPWLFAGVAFGAFLLGRRSRR